MSEDRLMGFSGSQHDAEVAAQRILIAALNSGTVKVAGVELTAAGADKIGSFLGQTAVAIAKELKRSAK